MTQQQSDLFDSNENATLLSKTNSNRKSTQNNLKDKTEFYRNRKIIKAPISEYQENQYLSYTAEVLEFRSLPHIRDGLKTVQRRILYGMKNLGCVYTGSLKKSARVVGEVMGTFHPHGDSSIYIAAVNLALDYKQRAPLIIGQGNMGSIDGDKPAAMRYTEMKMSEIGTYGFLHGLNEHIVDYVPNYDNSTSEPTVLPVRFPNLLVNGSMGIAVAFSTSFLPHNFNEVIDATLAYQANPNITTDEIIEIMPAPDFPTGGVVYNLEGYRKAIETGHGTVKCRPTYTIEDNKLNTRSRRMKRLLVINTVPFNSNKETIVSAMRDYATTDPDLINWIDHIADESERNNIRIVVYLCNEGNDLGDLIFNKFCQELKSLLTPSFTYNMTATGFPNEFCRVVNFCDIFREFLAFRREINIRRANYSIAQMEKEIHSLRGIMAVLETENTLNETIALIKAHKSAKEANEALRNRFGIDEGQAQEILRMSLQKLTTDELDNMIAHNAKLINDVTDLKDFIINEPRIQQAIRDDLIEVKERFGRTKAMQRKTLISYDNLDVKDKSQFTKEENSVIILTESGYVKVMPNDDISTQNRNGKGKTKIETNEDDNIKTLLMASSHDNVLFFTTSGKVFGTKVWDLPKGDKGRHIRNIFNELTGDIVDMMAVSDENLNKDNIQIVLTTKLGKVRRTYVSEYQTALKRQSGLTGCKLTDKDELINVSVCKENDHLMLVTSNNLLTRFIINDENLLIKGRTALGVDGVKLSKGEIVTDAIIIPVDKTQLIYNRETRNEYQLDENGDVQIAGQNYSIVGKYEVNVLDPSLINENRYLMIISEKGVGKKTSLSEYKVQKRRDKGLTITKENDKSGKVIKSVVVSDGDEVIITSTQKTIKVAVDNINEYSRTAVGDYIMNVDDNDTVVAMTKV